MGGSVLPSLHRAPSPWRASLLRAHGAHRARRCLRRRLSRPQLQRYVAGADGASRRLQESDGGDGRRRHCWHGQPAHAIAARSAGSRVSRSPAARPTAIAATTRRTKARVSTPIRGRRTWGASASWRTSPIRKSDRLRLCSARPAFVLDDAARRRLSHQRGAHLRSLGTRDIAADVRWM